MAHAIDERTQNQKVNPAQSGQHSDPDRGTGKTGKVYEYQQGKEITGEQHGTEADKTRSQPTHKEHHQSPPGNVKK